MARITRMVALLAVSVLAAQTWAYADDFKLIELDDASVTYRKYTDGHDPLFAPNDPMNEALAVSLSTSVFKYGYWDSRVQGQTDSSQYHTVSLSMTAGIHVSKYIDVFAEHFSEHELDGDYPEALFSHFPCQDSIGINLHLFRKTKPPSLLP